MALFTDGSPSGIEDLSAQDSQLMDVASTEGINVTKKLALAQEQLGLELDGLLRRMAAEGAQTSPGINGVVVTTPLRLWHTYLTLKLVYGDSYYNQFNDRYAQKRDEFERQAKWAYDKLIDAGLGMVSDPVPIAPTPTVTAAPGSLPPAAYYVTGCWVNAAGEEGAAAVPASVEISGQTIMAQPGAAPGNAAGWNIYIGTAPEAMARQNLTPLAPGQSWLQPGVLTTSGAAPGNGQPATYFYAVPRMIRRG
jgi:hypothetical protein